MSDIHGHRRLALVVARSNRKGTPIRHARGVVVSSTMGQATVTLDGGSTQVKAFCPSHSQSHPSGTVVDVLCVGNKNYVLADYSGDVPVGGLVGSYNGPAVQTDIASGTHVLGTSAAFPLVTGHTYKVTLSAMLATQITANATGTVQCWATDSLGLLPGGLVRAFAATSPTTTVPLMNGTGVEIITAAANSSNTFTVNANDGSASGALRFAASSVTLLVERVT